MKKILSNDYLILGLRTVLGFIFVIASIEKMADPAAFATSIGNYKLVSSSIALFVATYLPWIELLAGLGILFGIFSRGSSLLILIMLVVFTAGIVSAVMRGLDISCGCFTQDPTVGKVGWYKVGENIGMILGSLVLFYSHSLRFSLEQHFRTQPREEEGTIAAPQSLEQKAAARPLP